MGFSLLLLLSLYVLILIANGYKMFIHSQEGLGNREIPELQQMSEFYSQVTRTMRLADGRSAECMIPVFSPMYQNYIPVVGEEFHQARLTQVTQQPSQAEEITQLSEEDANYALRSLENQCAEYRTTTFLWQFCYKKYLRQFDDIQTLVNAQKKGFEDIYAGYHSSYNKTTNITKNKSIPSLSAFNYFQVEDKTVPKAIKYSDTIYKINPHISSPNITHEQPYIFAEGKLIQFVGFSNLTLSSKSQVVIAIERIDEKKKKLQKVRVIHMVDRSFGLLKEALPRAEMISKYTLEVTEVDSAERNANILSLYDGIYLYGKKLSALRHLAKGDILIITTFKGAFFKEIKRVINNNFIELQYDQSVGLKGQQVFIDTIQIFSRGTERKSLLKYEIVEFQKKERFLFGSLLFGVNYLWAEIGDTLLFVSRDKVISSMIKQILPSGVIIDQDLSNFSGYIIKANYQSLKKQEYLEIATTGQYYYYLNPRIQNANFFGGKKPSIKPGYLLFKESKERKAEDCLEFTDLESFQLNESEAGSPVRYFMFTPLSVLGEEFKQLKILLTSSLIDKKEEVQIDFSSDSNIFAYDRLVKSNIASKNKRYENVTLFNPSRVWILVDSYGYVRLGFSDVISPSTQALSLKTNYTNLRFLRVLAKQTFNIEILTPISGSFNTHLDFTVLDTYSQLRSNSTVTENHYDKGEFCPPIDRSRSFTVEYVCGDSFFSLIHVSEPSVCTYHVLVETYLLCPHQSASISIPSPPKSVHCILKTQNK